MDKIIFHIDVNSAFLSWTAVDELNKGSETDLRTVPSIIGGDQDKRHGIVLAKSIPAKKYHIQTAEPIVSAIRKCPNLIVASPDFTIYKRMSNELMDYLHTLTSDIEKASIDECYLDFTPIAHMYESPIAAANMIRKEVYNRFGFTVNVGISDKKVLAKMASDFTKPDRTHTLFSYEIKEKMWPLPVGDLFLCGKSAVEILKKLDIKTIGNLATCDLNILTSHLKSHGKVLWEFANGIDNSEVETVRQEVKGIGNSTTGAHDITDFEEVSNVLFNLAESVANRMHSAGFMAMQVTVEIKYATFKSVSHQMGLPSPIETAKAIHDAALLLFESLWDGSPIRLLGVRVTKLVSVAEPVQLSIFDMPTNTLEAKKTIKNPQADIQLMPVDNDKQKKLENALRNIRSRYGDDSIKKGF